MVFPLEALAELLELLAIHFLSWLNTIIKKKSSDILLSVSEEAYLMKGMIIKKLFALFPRACLEVRSFLWRGRSSMRNH